MAKCTSLWPAACSVTDWDLLLAMLKKVEIIICISLPSNEDFHFFPPSTLGRRKVNGKFSVIHPFTQATAALVDTDRSEAAEYWHQWALWPPPIGKAGKMSCQGHNSWDGKSSLSISQRYTYWNMKIYQDLKNVPLLCRLICWCILIWTPAKDQL